MSLPLPAEDSVVRELSAQVAGRYALERELGRGGMGTVCLARDLRLDRLVAIKVLPPELAVRPELRERFLREIRTAASFSHPNIVPVHEVQESPALLYFVMGYVEGETLTQRVRRQGPLPVADAARLLQEVAWALSYAHGRGVVHRDVKPDNILLERATGRALVMDFGIARSVAASGLTQVGETVGTPHFMSPEQAAGDRVDGRSDLYSLGCVAWFAVTGRLPFDAGSAQAVMMMQVSQPAQPVTRLRPDLPAALAQVIDRCLAKEPDQRFATGEALVEALEGVRTRRAEVPPAIRLWIDRSDQFFRNGLLLALFSSQIVGRARLAALDQMIFAGMFTAAVLAIWAQVPLGMRELARQGFGFGELSAGLRQLDDERRATRAALRADPGFRRRRRRLWLALLGGGVLSAGLIAFAYTRRHPIGGGNFQVEPIGTVAVFLGVTLLVAILVTAIATVAKNGRADERIHRLWTGRGGRLLFRLGTLGLGQDRSPSAGGAGGPLAMLESLPPEARRRLGGVRAILERLEGEVDRLTRRERELDAGLAEARSGGSSSDRQQALVSELEQARADVTGRRGAILAALDNHRLLLLRLKSGLGSADEVAREAEQALDLIEVRR